MINKIKCLFGKHELEDLNENWSYCIHCGKVWTQIRGYIFPYGKLKNKYKQGNRYYWDV